jgi:hypothetical protein
VPLFHVQAAIRSVGSTVTVTDGVGLALLQNFFEWVTVAAFVKPVFTLF